MFTYFRNAINNSKPAKEYLDKRGLDFTRTEIGYNSAHLHHGQRKKEELFKTSFRSWSIARQGTHQQQNRRKGLQPLCQMLSLLCA